jgi:hypothetical protein
MSDRDGVGHPLNKTALLVQSDDAISSDTYNEATSTMSCHVYVSTHEVASAGTPNSP